MSRNSIPRRRSVRRVVMAAAVGVPLLLTACGSDDDGSSEPSEVTITASDYKFEGLPDSVAVGSTFSLANSSQKELHEAVAVRIPDDEERSIDELAALPEAELEAIFAGEPAFVLLAMPDAAAADQIVAVGDGTVTEAGRYAVVCFIPTGADPQAFMDAVATSEGGPPDVEGGPPHFANGMYAEFEVG
jgi:hypothetical protein